MTPRPRADRFGKNTWLRSLLARPALTMPLVDLAQHWRQTDVSFVCALPAGFERGDWMVRSVRGALGRILADDGGKVGNGAPASAFEGLYQNHGMIDGIHIPKPVRFSVVVGRAVLTIRIRLFGAAEIWRDEIVAAMAAALHQGIGLRENGRILRPWPLLDWYWQRSETSLVPDCTGSALIVLETPFKPGSSELFSGDFVSAIPTLVSRLRGLALWSSIEATVDHVDLRDMIDQIRFDMGGRGYGLGGFLKGSAQGPVPIVGYVADLSLHNIPSGLWATLGLGTQTTIGAHGIYGFGQYSLRPLS